ncbi:peptidoglycan DD-metalloendopeptidase family protein [Patescibacteria group bacterium]|nr:peptidoglycan DD-metalloendopeptidase family protein [Patescibacteria group bacterium]
MVFRELGCDLTEYCHSVSWYLNRKATYAGVVFETGKSLVVTVLKARRGTYQKPFLHAGMVIITATAVISAPLIVNEYPTAAAGRVLSAATSPSAVLNTAADITNVDTVTQESEKPRRDVVEYTVQSGDTLSTVAKKFSNDKLGITVDVASILTLNNMMESKVLKPGDVIKIPPVSGVIVTVKKGDTIQSLAKKYGLPSPQPIVDWPYNSFANDETFALTAGQTLVIPGGVAPEVAAPVAPRIINAPSLFSGGTGQFVWPTNGIITQYFSWYHPADDIANNIGTPILAADSGRVVTVLYQNHDYGFHVIIDHGNGYRTLYGHMSRIDVTVGQNVSRGQQIGLMGSTGRSTGPHLHFEIYQGGTRVNPLGLLK